MRGGGGILKKKKKKKKDVHQDQKNICAAATSLNK